MGVLACDRHGCENIMCDFYSHEHGYICWECREELLNKGPTNVYHFMNSAKDCVEISSDWKEYVNSEFKSRYDEETA